MARTVGWWTLVLVEAVWLSSIVVLWTDGALAIIPDYYLYFFGGALIGIVWFVVFVIRLCIMGFRDRPLVPFLLNVRNYREPMLLIAGFAVAHTSVLLFEARFSLSEPALTAFVSSVRPGTHSTDSAWVGLFRVKEVDAPGESVRLITGQCDLLNDCGFAYNRSGPPQVVGEDRYVHFKGPWWYWHRSW